MGKVCQFNNSVIFSERPIRSEDFFNQMVEALDIIEKIGCIPILIKKIKEGRGKVILQDPATCTLVSVHFNYK